MQTKTMPKAIKEALDKIEGKRKRVEAWIPIAEMVEKDIAPRLKEIPEIQPYLGADEHNIDVGFEVGQVNGVLLKCETTDFRALTPIREHIRRCGFGAPEIEDYAIMRRRTFTYKKDEGGLLVLMAFLPFDGKDNKCEYVKVGEESTPVYELRCNGDVFTTSDSESTNE